MTSFELGIGKSAAGVSGRDVIKLMFQSPRGWIDVWESLINGFATLGIVIIVLRMLVSTAGLMLET